MTDTPLPPEVFELHIHPEDPLVIVDVDEVLGLFMRGFETFVGARGLEMRIEKFALFQNIYRPGADQPIDLAEGRQLFDAFFASDPHIMDPTPGGADALAALSRRASVVVLTNAPASSRAIRAKWLTANALPYPMIINTGPKGRAVAALSERTTGKVAFIDDLLHDLDSVEKEAPRAHRFQMVADDRLRLHAPSSPRHDRFDDWPSLGDAIARALSQK